MRKASLARGSAIVGMAVALTLTAPTAALAADPAAEFGADTATVFIGHESPTILSTVQPNADGTGFDLVTEIGAQDISYNALGFNTDDNFLYGMLNGTNQALRIGSNGTIENLGPVAGLSNGNYNQGTFGLDSDAGKYLIREQNALLSLWSIDLTTSPAPTATLITLSADVPNVSDIVYRDGYVWAYDGFNSADFYRISVDWTANVGQVSKIPSPLGLTTQPYGGQWLYGNGNLGLTGNTSGTVYQIAIIDAASASPSFRIVSQAQGAHTLNNDAASILGLPVDLELAKTGAATAVAGEQYSYTITVTNLGEGVSSGSLVTDVLPAGFESPSTTSTNCTIAAGAMNCAIGVLAVGASTTITVSGVVAVDATAETLENSASVEGNEADPNPDNNSAVFGPTMSAPAPSLGLVKSASTDKATSAGQVIDYLFTVTNTGNVALTGISVTEGTFSGKGTLGAIDCTAAAAELLPTASTTCSAMYTVVAADLTGEPITNTASASATGPDGPVESNLSSVQVPTVKPVSELTLTGVDGLNSLGLAGAVLLAAGSLALFFRRKLAA